MFKCNVPKKTIRTEDEELEEVQEYLYVGQVLTLKKRRHKTMYNDMAINI